MTLLNKCRFLYAYTYGWLGLGHPAPQGMRVIIQRVKQASVAAHGTLVSAIDDGYLLLVGIHRNDTEHDALELARKLCSLCLFSTDQCKRWAMPITDTEHKVLAVSQFTLYANCEKGCKPDFHAAMAGEMAVKLFDRFVEAVNALMAEKKGGGEWVLKGAFGDHMQVSLVNDGPVTILLESKAFMRK